MSIQNLIAEITNEVIKELNTEIKGPYSTCLLFIQIDIEIENILNTIDKIKGKNIVKVILPKWAYNLYGNSYWEQYNIEVNYIDYNDLRNKELIKEFDKLVVFAPNDSFLVKLSKLAKDTLPLYLVQQAIAFQKQVFFIEEYIRDSLLQKFKSRIEGLGINIVSLKKLNEIIFTVPKIIPSIDIKNTDATCSNVTSNECISCQLCATLCSNIVKQFIDTGATRIGATLGISNVPDNIAMYIDHTLLKPEATEKDIIKLCEEAKKYKFASVCVNPSYVPLCANLLKGTGVKVCTVIGFPLGATTTETKVFETKTAIQNGADEIDMVINVGALKSGNYKKVEEDIREVVKACQGKICKVILETSLLNQEEKVIACRLAKQAGADFVKTSTGFSSGGATVEDIALMRKTVGPDLGVKASGGIRDYDTAIKMIQAGATRIGASASVAIVNKQVPSKESKY